MAIADANLYFTGVGTSGFSPTAQADNIAPFTIDTSPFGLPTGSGGGAAAGYNSGVNTNAGRDLGVGGEMWFEVLVTVAVAQSSGSATFKLVTDSTATITSVNVLVASSALAAAALVAGAYYRVQFPVSASYLTFIGLDVLISTANWTAGTVEGKLLMNIQQSDLYQSGFAVN